MNIGLAVTDFMTQLLLVIVGGVLVLSPETLVDNVQLGRRADLEGLLPRDPGRHDRLHRHRDDLEHGRGGQGRDEDDPGRDQARRHRGVRDLRVPARPSRCRRCRCSATRTATTSRSSASARTRAASPATRSSASSSRSTSGSSRAPGEIYVGLLAATILFIATNAGIIGVSRLVYSMGLHRQVPDRLRQLHPRYGTPWIGIIALRRDRLRDDDPGPGGLPGQHLRLRRDALVHRSRTSRSSSCGSPTPTGRARTAGRARCGSPVARCRSSRSSAASGPGWPSSS